MKKNLIISILLALLFLNIGLSFAATAIGKTIEAKTTDGDKVILKPTGRWEYVNQEKAESAAKVAKQYPENKVCPPGSQGGWFGTKCILPGDKAFNRKSRIGK
ncbi:MAG: hypothetical protein V3U89_08945 [Methylophilaceae bacterium]